MSEIAQEARKLADAQELRSAEIEQLALKTKNASKQALTEANEAIWGGQFINSLVDYEESRSVLYLFLYKKLKLHLVRIRFENTPTSFTLLGEATSKQIAAMLRDLNKTGSLLDQTKKFAEEQLAEASTAYDLAAKSVTAVEGLKLPELKPDEVRCGCCFRLLLIL